MPAAWLWGSGARWVQASQRDPDSISQEPRELRCWRRVARGRSRSPQPGCVPLCFGGEKQPGLGAQGPGFECSLRYYLASRCLEPSLGLSFLFSETDTVLRALASPGGGCKGTKALRKSQSAGGAPRLNFHPRLAGTKGSQQRSQGSVPGFPAGESGIGPWVPGTVFRTPEPDQSTIPRAGL